MLFGFIVAYALATLFANALLASQAGLAPLGGWLYALTHNRAIDFGGSIVYLAVTAYFAGGMLWALLYARWVEPRLSGPSWWRGALFSLVPAAVSLLIVLPLLDGGLLGLELGAGPLPLIGNVLLHVIYGATLGLVYGPFGDLSAETLGPPSTADRAAMGRAEATAARATLVGGVLGGLVGLLPLLIAGPLRQDGVLGTTPAAFLLATVLGGLMVGALMGSFIGLPGSASDTD